MWSQILKGVSVHGEVFLTTGEMLAEKLPKSLSVVTNRSCWFQSFVKNFLLSLFFCYHFDFGILVAPPMHRMSFCLLSFCQSITWGRNKKPRLGKGRSWVC